VRRVKEDSMKHPFLALAALLGALLLAPLVGATVNVNTATKDELVGLPGIGPAKAQAIVDYRNQHGPFRSVDDLRKVKGIGEKLFLQIRNDVVVTGGAAAKPAAAAAKGDGKAEPKAQDGKAPQRAASGSGTIVADKARK
jgi:competence protein ComEA